MDSETAAFWLQVITAGAACLWLVGALFVRQTRHLLAQPMAGELRVPLPPNEIVARFGRAVATSRGVLQSALIESATNTELRWSSNGPVRHRGTMTIDGSSTSSVVRWEVHCSSGMLVAARLVVLIGALVVVGLSWALNEYVVTSDNLAVRAQAMQMVQAIHVLWPPFLLAGLPRKLRKMVGNEVHRTLQNMQFS